MSARFLSVIVPVYRAEVFIERNLRNFQKIMAALVPKHLDQVELIAVIDGYVDKSREEAEKVDGVRVIGYDQNKGKGHALQVGFSHARGNLVMLLDADGDFNPQQIVNFFPYLASADLVVGSKRHPFSKVSYPVTRQILSRGFQLLSWFVLGINLRDTQSGLKIMKKEVLDVIMPSLIIERWAFDLELCFLAMKHGFRMVEAPVSLEFQGRSTMNPRVPFSMALDVFAIRWRYSVKKLYQKRYQQANFGRMNAS